MQEKIIGDGVGCSFFSVDGVVQTSYFHKRLIEYPISGGSSTYRTRHINEKIMNGCEEIIRKYKWSGFIMFEFKKRNEEYFLIEINPRIWGSINQGLNDNANFFEYLFGSVDMKGFKKTYNSPLIYLSLLNHLIRLDIKPFVIFIKNISKNKSDINLVHDFKGWLSSFIFKS
jgi:predicted ATP-grasp superfamily ATP-dependent carboligase